MKIHETKNRLIRIISIYDAEEKITITEEVATKTIQNYPKTENKAPNKCTHKQSPSELWNHIKL